jgi:hypothetical protein
MTCSSTAMPLEPCRSKNADCGFTTGATAANASTAVIANFSSPNALSVSPQASSSDGCGSIPTQSRPRACIASVSLDPNVIVAIPSHTASR